MMKINKELFEKLSKKSQEEYKKRIDKVREIPFIYAWVTYLRWFAFTLVAMLIILPLWKIAFGWEIFLTLFKFVPFIIRFFSLIIAIGFTLDFLILLMKSYKINKIREDYFKIEVKDEKAK